jgi:hypothetical protein
MNTPRHAAPSGVVGPQAGQETHLWVSRITAKRIRKGYGQTRRYLRGDPGSIVRAGVALHANGWRYPMPRGGWDPDPWRRAGPSLAGETTVCHVVCNRGIDRSEPRGKQTHGRRPVPSALVVPGPIGPTPGAEGPDGRRAGQAMVTATPPVRPSSCLHPPPPDCRVGLSERS